MVYGCDHLFSAIAPHESNPMAHRILGGIYLLLIEPINNGTDLKAEYGVTHVLSAVSGALPPHLAQDYHHLQISISDEETSDLLRELPAAMDFMDSALFPNGLDPENKKHQGAVLVHCAQGQSRSVSIVVAYLMKRYNLSYAQALHAVARKVPGAQPNDGFVEQLKLFAEMKCTVDLASAGYRRFLVANSLKLDPSGSSLRQLDVFAPKKDALGAEKPAHPAYTLRCKRCRQVLASEADIDLHDAPGADSRQSKFVKNAPNSRRIVSVEEAASTCSHYFMGEPCDWMRAELDKLEIEGKFACPKCDAKVGGYSWRGLRCLCGKWMIPALHLQAAKVDEMSRAA